MLSICTPDAPIGDSVAHDVPELLARAEHKTVIVSGYMRDVVECTCGYTFASYSTSRVQSAADEHMAHAIEFERHTSRVLGIVADAEQVDELAVRRGARVENVEV